MTAPGRAVEFHDVYLALGGRTILANVDITLYDNEFIALLGPNGSGKTTLMRAILGLIAPAQGRIEVLGRPAVRGNPMVGYMPQTRNSAGIAGLRGWDYVAVAIDGHCLGLPLPSREARREVDRVLDLVGARDLARRPLDELSGGERQRLLFAQALVGRPRLLLLDEPLISLDPTHQSAIVTLAKSLQTHLGIGVVFSAHELNPLLAAIDRVLYLGRGEAALGTVEEVVTTPVLSRLYGSAIEVAHANGRIFVMPSASQTSVSGHGSHGHA